MLVQALNNTTFHLIGFMKGVIAVNYENDTCFVNGLVMGSADCPYYVGLVKTPERLF